MLEMTECERVETTIRKRQLWFAGALARQEETRLPRRLTRVATGTPYIKRLRVTLRNVGYPHFGTSQVT